MNDVAASSNSKEEKMEHSLDVLTFKYENSDLLNCIEESNSKSQFHQSQFFSDLFNFTMIYLKMARMILGPYSKLICY